MVVTALGLVVVVQLAIERQPTACREVERTALLHAQQELARGDEAAARGALDFDASPCVSRQLARLALRGWVEARALAPIGGAVDQQDTVRRTLDEIRALAGETNAALEIEYAETTIRAAIAAAQDERPEMELLLTHARDLSERLLRRDRRAAWPRTFNIVAGELWFEVDRYADAAAAYERAVRADPSALALIGLSRALARVGRLDEACATYRRVTDAAPSLRAAANPDLLRCR
jgi:tetratricopeptide (TPR) repeat protein